MMDASHLALDFETEKINWEMIALDFKTSL